MVKSEGKCHYNHARGLAIKHQHGTRRHDKNHGVLETSSICTLSMLTNTIPTDICQPGDHASKPHTFTSRKMRRVSISTQTYMYRNKSSRPNLHNRLRYVSKCQTGRKGPLQSCHRPSNQNKQGSRRHDKNHAVLETSSICTLSMLTKTIPTDICQPGDHASKPHTFTSRKTMRI